MKDTMYADRNIDLMTPGEVCEALRISMSTLRVWAKSGRVQVITLPSGHRRYLRSEIEEMLHPEQEQE